MFIEVAESGVELGLTSSIPFRVSGAGKSPFASLILIWFFVVAEIGVELGLTSSIPLKVSGASKSPFATLMPFWFLMLTQTEFGSHKNKKVLTKLSGLLLAEAEGFEPPVPRGTTVFKTAAFDHSATPL